jgi:integrase
MRACRKAGIPHWHPNQLRHTAATKIRQRYGLEAARQILGHRSTATTEIYAEADLGRVVFIMAEIG